MPAETLEFKAELRQLLHLITHSLYSDRDVFLRELVSNAADAINKARFDSLANADKLEGNTDWKITLIPDAAANTLTVRDNGIGMSREEVVENLGTVAKSGTKAFVEAVKAQQGAAQPGLIGQFGVGFYAAFMVADTVTVVTRPGGAGTAGTKWVSDGQGEFTVEAIEKEGRGTDVILHLKPDALTYANGWKLRGLVTKYSNFLEHPVALVETEEKDGKTETTETVVNTRTAVWLRNKSEVKPEEYQEFYKQLTYDPDPPAKVLHFRVEGKSEFTALLFVPGRKPAAFDFEEQKAGLKLYVQRVLIMDKCEAVLPPYLRFVTGVVDSADLPLNVSREILQQNPHLEIIRKNVVRNILSGLDGMRNTEPEAYAKFFRGLGQVLKEGLTRDWENREKIADLLLFETANGEPGKLVTLAEYVETMPAGQEDIVTLTGDDPAQLRRSPYLEGAKAKGYDVLLLTDPIDEFVFPGFDYKGKKFAAADRSEATGEVEPGVASAFAPLLNGLKEKLPDVADVKLTARLTDSAACLVADSGGMSAHLERLMKKFGEAPEANKRVLELNPAHPAVLKLRALFDATPADPRVEAVARLLLDQAVVAEGSRVADPAGFAKRVNELIVASVGA